MPEESRASRASDEMIPSLTVDRLVHDPKLEISLTAIAGHAGGDRPIRHPRVQKNGLALVGHTHGVVPTRVQVLGETELSYLDALGHDARGVSSRSFFSLGLSCVVVTGGREPVRPFVSAAEATGTPVFVSQSRSSRTINALHAVLDDRLAPQTQIHGVLVDVHGVGVLLLGKSGIGKSECALELLIRGHRLIADDVVRCDWRPPGMVFGQPAELLRYHIEIRGLGVLDVRELFGITAVRDRKRIDLVVRLCDWNEEQEFDRLGLDERRHAILGTEIREVRVPVRPGRDMGSIIEMAARNELVRLEGRHPASEFLTRLEGRLVHRSTTSEAADERETTDIEADRSTPGPAQKPSWSTLAPHSSTTESSAWIPAARKQEKGDE